MTYFLVKIFELPDSQKNIFHKNSLGNKKSWTIDTILIKTLIEKTVSMGFFYSAGNTENLNQVLKKMSFTIFPICSLVIEERYLPSIWQISLNFKFEHEKF